MILINIIRYGLILVIVDSNCGAILDIFSKIRNLNLFLIFKFIFIFPFVFVN